ncbi:hypothetical protein DFP72DRAFT_896480 [Ephemerocybe angulata]|uniref:Uncharacterized protein n=1 Tax=Ephemerocybe angulata TaxID=980116 RepID=A0A8H6I0V4_9AGAR|nr:hypothetical protein DFP72DRAFT_896480 [Tulosesus angulatus]
MRRRGDALSSMWESAWICAGVLVIHSMLLDVAAWRHTLLDAGECVDVCRVCRSHPLHAARCGGECVTMSSLGEGMVSGFWICC